MEKIELTLVPVLEEYDDEKKREKKLKEIISDNTNLLFPKPSNEEKLLKLISDEGILDLVTLPLVLDVYDKCRNILIALDKKMKEIIDDEEDDEDEEIENLDALLKSVTKLLREVDKL